MFTANTTLMLVATFLPVLGALVLLFVPKGQRRIFEIGSLLIMIASLLLSLPFWFGYDRASDAVQWAMSVPWIPALGVRFAVGMDGISLLLWLLTTFIGPIAIACSFKSIEERHKEYYVWMLVLQTAMLGVFITQDMFLFYLFWEVMLVPMYFLIGIWGGPQKLYAAIKLFLYTLAGSVLMLVAILAIYFLQHKATGTYNFSLESFQQMAPIIAQQSKTYQHLMALAFFIGFAIKVPMFPFHTWLPDAHVQAPTAGSVILAGVLLKLGGYGFIRFAIPMFPQAAMHYAKPLAILSVIAIVYGALVAMVQRDIKKLVAYSSVSHMGFVMLGLASFTVIGTQGAMLQMLNHGISTGALFLLVGMLYDRAHTRMIADFGGVVTKMPVFTTFFLIVTLSSIGLPLTNGFVGEFWILNGTFLSGFSWGRLYACLATSGVLLGAVYMLWMFKRVFWGPENKDEDSGTHHLHSDLNAREIAVMLPLVVLIIWMGVHPKTFVAVSEAPVAALLQEAKAPAPRTFVLRPAVHEAPAHAQPAPAGHAEPAAHEVHR